MVMLKLISKSETLWNPVCVVRSLCSWAYRHFSMFSSPQNAKYSKHLSSERSPSSWFGPLSHGGHFEFQENKKLCFCTSSLARDERLDVQNLLFQHCVIKVYYDIWIPLYRTEFPKNSYVEDKEVP